MARYTIYAYSNESSAEYYKDYNSKQDAKFTFNLPNLTGVTITSIVCTAPIISTRSKGGYGNFTLMLDSTNLGSSTYNDMNRWASGAISIAGKQNQKITVDLKATEDYNTGRSLGAATAAVTVEGEFTETPVSPLDGERIAKSQENTFTWSSTIVLSTIKQQKLYWKYVDESVYNEINLNADDTEYTFPAYTFTNGSINWYLEGIDGYNNVSKTPIQTVHVGILPSVVPAYPNNVNIRNGNNQIFTWELQETIPTGQKSYELRYKADSSDTWTVIVNESSNQYHEFEADTFATEGYTWTIKVTNNDDNSTEHIEARFNAIGGTDAPNIISVTNSAIPKITWDIDSQDTFELEIFSNEERVYSSGVQVGVNVREFTPNIMLDDGNYIVKMRAMNEYGYFTSWSDYSFVLNTDKPEPVECIVYANDSHGVNIIKGDGDANELYVLKREFGNTQWDIIAKFKDIYSDNTIITDTKYEYALRNYKKDAGYADSNVVAMVISYQGCLIYDGNDYAQLYKTEDEQFNISHRPSKSFNYSYMIGRRYPIKESSEWLAHSTSISCFVMFEEYEKLERFFESNDPLWFKGKDFSFKCSIDDIQINETLLGKGYSIGIELSRIDEDEVILVE